MTDVNEVAFILRMAKERVADPKWWRADGGGPSDGACCAVQAVAYAADITGDLAEVAFLGAIGFAASAARSLSMQRSSFRSDIGAVAVFNDRGDHAQVMRMFDLDERKAFIYALRVWICFECGRWGSDVCHCWNDE